MKENKKLYIVFTILIIIVTITSITKIMQNDTFFTIATGNSIIEDGYDNMDHLTYHENLSFYKVRWPFDLIITTLYNNFNFGGIYIFVLIIACIIELSLFNILLKRKNNIILSFIMTIFSTWLIAKCWGFTARGQIMSYLFLLWEIYVIEKLIETKKKRYILFLFILSILLVNFHGSAWPMSIVLVLPYVAEGIMNKFVKSNKFIMEAIDIKLLIIAILVIIIGGFISPIGTYMYTYMFKVEGGLPATFISEMQHTEITTSVGMATTLTIVAVLMLSTKAKMKLSDFLLFFGLYFMAIIARRHQMLLYLFGMLPIARLISNFINEYDKENLFDKANSFVSKNKVIVCLTIFIIIEVAPNIVSRCREEYVDEKKYPVEAVEYIKNNLDYQNMRIFNGFDFGSYLELNGILTFVDSRSEIFCEEFNDTEVLQDWLDTARGYKNYNETFEKYNIDYAIVENEEIINTYLSKDEKYKKVHEDEYFSVYIKK